MPRRSFLYNIKSFLFVIIFIVIVLSFFASSNKLFFDKSIETTNTVVVNEVNTENLEAGEYVSIEPDSVPLGNYSAIEQSSSINDTSIDMFFNLFCFAGIVIVILFYLWIGINLIK